jgi:hypothetical protein
MNLTFVIVPFVALSLAGCMGSQSAQAPGDPANRTAGDSNAITPQTADTPPTSDSTIGGVGAPPVPTPPDGTMNSH